MAAAALIASYQTAIAKGVLKTTIGPFTTVSDYAYVNAPNYPDKSITAYVTGANKWPAAKLQVVGCGVSGGTYVDIHSASGAVMTFTTGKALVINENPPWIKIKVSSTTTANVNRRIWVSLMSQSTRR